MKTLSALLTTGLLLSSVGGLHAQNMTVTSSTATAATTGLAINSFGIDLTQPANSSVYTVEGDGGFLRRNVNNNRLNTQTFQVGTTFTLDSIYLPYQNGGYNDGTITLSIYNVADVNASTLTLGSLVLQDSWVDNATTRAAAGFISSGDALLRFSFTGIDQVTLAATTGTAGYALQFSTTTGGNAVFAWQRNDNTYAGGTCYEFNGSTYTIPTDPNNGSTLDYAMAITAVAPVPEPSTMALAGMGSLGMLFALRRRSV